MAVKHKIKIEQGATFNYPITWKPGGVTADLTGFTARMEIRPSIDSDVVLARLDTINGSILIDGLLGKVTLYLTDAQTALLKFDDAVYDLELVAPNEEVTRLIEGSVSLSREVTRGP